MNITCIDAVKDDKSPFPFDQGDAAKMVPKTHITTTFFSAEMELFMAVLEALNNDRSRLKRFMTLRNRLEYDNDELARCFAEQFPETFAAIHTPVPAAIVNNARYVRLEIFNDNKLSIDCVQKVYDFLDVFYGVLILDGRFRNEGYIVTILPLRSQLMGIVKHFGGELGTGS